MGVISENVEDVRARIAQAARKAGRSPEEITLIGVTKTIDIARIEELLDCGINAIGENRVQELLQKYDSFTGRAIPPAWHLVGHLQTNKVKYIIDKVDMIHSVDSIKLAQEIDRHAKRIEKRVDILIEINVGAEESKFGIEPKDLDKFSDEIVKLTNIRLKGLMTVAPFVEKSEENREIFKKMRLLLIDIAGKIGNNGKCELSMGMTNDYEVAVEEGATMIRIGTGLFGARDALITKER
jgi:pyridoxal phosphate enzyme (YggS family)